MISTIVVPLDGSPLAAHALGPARSLAEAFDASILLVSTHWEDGVGGAGQHLEQHAERLGVPRVETAVVHDRTAPEAILLRSADPTALVCMATHGRSGLGQAVLGSVAEAVVRAATHPVLLVGPGVRGWTLTRPSTLLVAVDGSPASEAVVPVAAEWVEMLDLSPHVVQVLPAGKAIVEKPRDVESAYVREIAARCTPEPTARHWQILRALDPASALVDHARELPATLVAMATHGRSGVGRVAVGSVATRVVHRAECPVLVTRPSVGASTST